MTFKTGIKKRWGFGFPLLDSTSPLATAGTDRISLRPYKPQGMPSWSKHEWQAAAANSLSSFEGLLKWLATFRNCPVFFPFGQYVSGFDPLTHLMGKIKMAFNAMLSSKVRVEHGAMYTIRYVNASQAGAA